MSADMSGTRQVKDHPGIYAYELKKGKSRKRYAFVATVQGRQRWGRGFRSIIDAETARDAMRELMRGGLGKAPAKITLKQYLEERWLPSLINQKASTVRNYGVDVKRIVAHIGEKRLADIRPYDVDMFCQALAKSGLTGASQRNTYTRLSQALDTAVKWEMILRNPCANIDAPRLNTYEAPVLEAEDLHRLIAAADATPWGALIYLAIATGMREGELFALRWPEIDVAAATLRIPKGKTKASVRAVRLGPATLERLHQHRIEQMARYTQLREDPAPLVFVSADCQQMDQSRFWYDWNKIRIAAGLPTLRFHDLRHARATLAVRAGIHPSITQRTLGHSSSRITMDIYTSLSAEDQAGSAETIEGMLGR